MNKHLGALMQKEMTRKEFLGTLGLGIATLLGFGSVIRLLSNKDHGSSPMGYGASVYGGRK
ncbi:MAG TPA: hypothetical protein VLH86_01295 [Patescibacteria group bacterium]|nr:hypothetical protein [Patescibacteria group bacterium]